MPMSSADSRESLRRCLASRGRAITRNRQPGKCCDPGCTSASETTLVALPASRRKDTA